LFCHRYLLILSVSAALKTTCPILFSRKSHFEVGKRLSEPKLELFYITNTVGDPLTRDCGNYGHAPFSSSGIQVSACQTPPPVIFVL